MKDSSQTIDPCVVIPVYNNAGTVGDVAAACRAQGLSVIVVDDGSTDGSGDAAAGVEGVTVRRIERNRGKGNALREGFRTAAGMGFSHGVTCDADGQHDPAQIPALLEAAARSPESIIIGERAMEAGGAPGVSKFGRSFSNFWFWVETGRTVGDAQSGLRVYPVAAFNALGTRLPRYEMEHEVLVRAAWSGVDILSVPVNVVYGRNVPSHFRKFRDNVRFSLLNTGLVLSRFSGLHLFMRRRAVGKKGWYHQETLGNRAGYEFFKVLYLAGGKRAAYGWLKVITAYYHLFAPGPAKKASLAYLRKKFPGEPERRLMKYRRELFWEFGQTILDRLIVGVRGYGDFRMLSDGLENIRETKERGKGVLLLGAHVGNFEAGALALAGTGIPIKIVGVRKETERVEKFLHAHYRDRRLPVETLTIQDEGFSFLEIPRALERGEVLAMLADRMWGDRVVSCPLLGKEARFPSGPFQLAAITGAPIVSWFVMKDDPDTYHFYATAPIEVPKAGRKDRERNIREAVEKYVANIEWILGKYPLQWYNFYDFWEEGLEP
jgi:predicted LPLAT superfamily acyltransferase